MIDAKTFDEVRDTRRLYRCLLDCMARPGKINQVSELLRKVPENLPCLPEIYIVGRTLLDQQVGFFLYDDAEHENRTLRYLQWVTGSRPVAVDAADYLLFAAAPPAPRIDELMRRIRIGTLLEPEKSATLILVVNALSGDSGRGLQLVLHGPGIRDRRTLKVEGLDPIWLRLRAERNREYPTGCDFIFIGKDGNLVALPRTTIIESGEASWATLR